MGVESDAAPDREHTRVKSILFRPPYGIDHQPEYAEEVQQLPYPQELGYLIVGQRVDPDDWRMTEDKHQRPAEEIASGSNAPVQEWKYRAAPRWGREARADRCGPAVDHRSDARPGLRVRLRLRPDRENARGT